MATLKDLIYEDRNVYEAALDRIDKIYNSHDEVWVSFSGGKDSLAMLKLVEEYFEKEGYTDKINVIFRDEETINTSVREFVLTFVDNPKYNFKYYATQLESEIYILGEKKKYIQWDENRDWVVPKPDCAITLKGVYDQYKFDKVLFEKKNRRVCTLVGIRADESLIRFSGITNSKVSYLTKNPALKNATLGKPIYDWKQNDIFKYFYDNDIEYCQVYDMQIFNKDSLRVATVLHAEAAKQLHKVKTLDPELYNNIMSIWPEVDVQARYYKDAVKGNSTKIALLYKEKCNGDYWQAIYRYIEENITDKYQKNEAMKKVSRVRMTRKNNARDNNVFGGYPALYVFGKVIGGAYKREIQPTGEQKDIYFEYENMSTRT
jgi:predicted phosphoadenosine phosphosulfate sulfurtransferase